MYKVIRYFQNRCVVVVLLLNWSAVCKFYFLPYFFIIFNLKTIMVDIILHRSSPFPIPIHCKLKYFRLLRLHCMFEF